MTHSSPVDRVAPARLGPERQCQIDLVDHCGGGRLRSVMLQIEPAGAAKRRLANWPSFGTDWLELLDCAVGIHLHEADPVESQLASRRFALEPDRAAEWTSGTNVHSAERSWKVVRPNPVCIGWQRDVPNVPEVAHLQSGFYPPGAHVRRW